MCRAVVFLIVRVGINGGSVKSAHNDIPRAWAYYRGKYAAKYSNIVEAYITDSDGKVLERAV